MKAQKPKISEINGINKYFIWELIATDLLEIYEVARTAGLQRLNCNSGQRHLTERHKMRPHTLCRAAFPKFITSLLLIAFFLFKMTVSILISHGYKKQKGQRNSY